MSKKTFTALLSKEIGGTISPKEQMELRQVLEKDRRKKEVYDEIHKFMQEGKPNNIAEIDMKLDEVWNKIAGMPDVRDSTSHASKHPFTVWGRIAAVVAVLIGLGWLTYYYLLPQEEVLYSQMIESGDESLYTVLDDGTQVWLDKRSRITHNDHFGEKQRKIRLTGKAFFDVAYSRDLPLTVTTHDADITVKGTAFNVDAASPDITEVTLISGLVTVKDNRKKSNKEILLHPKQKNSDRQRPILRDDNNWVVRDVTVVNDTIIPETEWLKGTLVFSKQRFSDLTKLMEERYRVTIRIENTTLAGQRFTGSIKNETLKQMLDALKQSYPFTYEINGSEVVIR